MSTDKADWDSCAFDTDQQHLFRVERQFDAQLSRFDRWSAAKTSRRCEWFKQTPLRLSTLEEVIRDKPLNAKPQATVFCELHVV